MGRERISHRPGELQPEGFFWVPRSFPAGPPPSGWSCSAPRPWACLGGPLTESLRIPQVLPVPPRGATLCPARTSLQRGHTGLLTAPPSPGSTVSAQARRESPVTAPCLRGQQPQAGTQDPQVGPRLLWPKPWAHRFEPGVPEATSQSQEGRSTQDDPCSGTGGSCTALTCPRGSLTLRGGSSPSRCLSGTPVLQRAVCGH